MTDLITNLRNLSKGKHDDLDVADDAADEIERLRAALRVIAYDPVEMSHDKVQMMYHKHIMLARKVYDASFPRKSAEYKPRDIDDNF